MATNIGFDRGHPYVLEGADEGEISMVGDRPSVTTANNRAVAFTLERSVNAGEDWETVLGDVIPADGVNMVDWESLSYGDTLYRAVAFTAEGATAETIITVHADSTAIWLSGGPAFGVTGRLPFDPQVQVTAGRERALKQYAGREHPVALVGEALNRTVAVAGGTFDDTVADEATADIDQLTKLAQTENPVFLFRDPDGRRIYGTIGGIDMSRKGAANKVGRITKWGYAFTLTETDKS
jgi:hypothetical protein